MLRVLIAAIFLLFLMGMAQAEKRVALVIGISNYELISPLANPKNDARLMASSLKDVGFEVVTAVDVDYRGMRRAVRRFGKKLRSSGKDAVGLLYYAGHGVQARGTNYLIPIGATIDDAADLEIETLSASNILAQMESAGNRLNLVILDACRNNPFKGRVRSAGRGLARIQAASGSLVAFAAAPGQVAADGTGENSPYTAALVDAIRQPGLAVEQIFKRVRVKVESETGGKQTPWEESSLRGDFFFTPKAEPKKPVAPSNQLGMEALFWNSVKESNSPASLQAYIDRFPEGTFTDLAKIMIDDLRRKSVDQQRNAKAERAKLENKLKAEQLARKLLEEERRIREAELERKLEEERLRTEKLKQERLKLAALPPQNSNATLPQPQTAEEMAALGRRLETGDGVDQDAAQAAHWYREAAAKGHAGAKYRLGLLYYNGRGVARSWLEASIQILEAIKLNHGPAVHTLTEGKSLHDPEFLRALQRRLKTHGLYRGSIDGKWGKGSRNAVLAFAGLAPISDVGNKKTKPRTVRSKQTKAPKKKVSDEKKLSPAIKRCIAKFGKNNRCRTEVVW